MARRIFLAVLIAHLCGCEIQAVPVSFYFDDGVDDGEKAAILSAADEWNKKAGPRLVEPGDVLIFMGYVSHKEFERNNLVDDIHTVYGVTTDNPAAGEIRSQYKIEPSGWGTPGGDILVFRDKILNDARNSAEGNGDASEEVVRHGYLNRVRRHTMHEFGHLLGLFHLEYDTAIMNSLAPSEVPDDDIGLYEADVAAFCAVYECE